MMSCVLVIFIYILSSNANKYGKAVYDVVTCASIHSLRSSYLALLMRVQFKLGNKECVWPETLLNMLCDISSFNIKSRSLSSDGMEWC